MTESRVRIRASAKDGREDLTSPRQVLRRLVLLSDGRQFREAAGIVSRLGSTVFHSVAKDIPLEMVIEALPHSAYLLETFFFRLNTEPHTPKTNFAAETIMWHLVKLFGNPHECGLRQRCMRLIQSIGIFDPGLKDLLLSRKRLLDQAVQGLGMHGLTADQSNSLNSLHVTLKNEIHQHITTYKMALQKLEELSPITNNQDPAFSSHQRQLAISYTDIQNRLIENKTLLTILEKPSLKQLGQLIAILNSRVERDKEVLFLVSQIKRIDPQANTENRPAAGLLMNFSRGIETILSVMKSSLTTPSISGYSSDGYHSDHEQPNCHSNIKMIEPYKQLYYKDRTDAFETLDKLPGLTQPKYLKEKILLSVIVLAFRSCMSMRNQKIADVRYILCASKEQNTSNLEKAVYQYLSDTADVFPTAAIEDSVAKQILVTLHEYPCLQNCSGLTKYITSCVKVAWKLTNDSSSYYLDTDFSLGYMNTEKHQRHHTSNKSSNKITSFLWPALMQDKVCVSKAVLTT